MSPSRGLWRRALSLAFLSVRSWQRVRPRSLRAYLWSNNKIILPFGTCRPHPVQERNELFVKWMTSGQNLARLDPNCV